MMQHIPADTVAWLLADENPAVAALTRARLLYEIESPAQDSRWATRNTYEPLATIIEHIGDGGSWNHPPRDYKKYEGDLWQIHFMGELHADPDDERVQSAIEYALSRQLPDNSWSTNGRPGMAIPCLTANVGRALARMGRADDERVVGALSWIADLYRTTGHLGCRQIETFTMNRYCHMVTPKILLFMSEVPETSWPEGAQEVRDACIGALREKHVHRCLPTDYRQFAEAVLTQPRASMDEARLAYTREHGEPEYGDKPGWLRFGYPLSYNSDALEALFALAQHNEPRRPEYEPALEAVTSSADASMRWTLRTTFNGKMLADIEKKGEPSRWVTLRALEVLAHFEVQDPT